jgi:salicylate hydroxylase
MSTEVLVAGGGIGGLAAALACARSGWTPRVLEQAAAFREIGAGIQLGPNAVRLLTAWGLGAALDAVASRPRAIRSRRADTGAELARLPLDDFEARYGAPYCTVHRADLHGVLLAACEAAGLPLQLASRVEQVHETGNGVRCTAGGTSFEGDLLVAADGVWSALRDHVPAAPAPRFTGDVAYRAMAPQDALPAPLRSTEVTAWLGRDLHAVVYPVRGGALLNVVLVTAGRDSAAREWDEAASAADLQAACAGACPALRAVLEAMPQWRTWPLYGTPPVPGSQAMANGRIALLGDAAHPMRPYLAQGAGMAIEDAAELGRVLALVGASGLEVPSALQRYAASRWQRCARVQARASRNGRIFHAQGPLRWARDVSLRLAGGRLMDVPWLYGQSS